MNFASESIKHAGGRIVIIALIDSNDRLKKWYLQQGIIETGKKDIEHLPFMVCFMSK
jgi:hypothetical protein